MVLPSKAALDAAVALLIVAGIFFAGWTTKGWKEDSARLAQERKDSAELLASMAAFDSAANRAIEELVAAKDQQARNRKEIVREITKVEYRDRECFGPDLVGLLNDAAEGRGAERPAGQVPGGAAAP